MSAERDTLHIVDGGGYVYRAYHGAALAAKKSGAPPAPNAALVMFEKMLNRLVADLRRAPRIGPLMIVVAFDWATRRSWRHELYPAYKAGRLPPDDLLPQLSRFVPLARAMGLPAVAVDGMEADDLIAALVARVLKTPRGRAQIHASDKDLLQLVEPRVVVVDEVRHRTFDEAAVLEKMGCAPARVCDLLAISGDAGDNVPGVDGVGEKGAIDLVKTYPSLAAMVAANPRIRGKHPLANAQQVDQLLLSARLVELRRDVDVGIRLNDCRMGQYSPGDVTRALTPEPLQLELGRPAAPPAGPPTWEAAKHEADMEAFGAECVQVALDEDQAERAAIMQHMGGLSREDAEAAVVMGAGLARPAAP